MGQKFEKLLRKHGDGVFEQVLQELRRDRGWSQRKLSARLSSDGVEVAQTTLSDIATGTNKRPNYFVGFALQKLWDSGEHAPKDAGDGK